LALGLGVGPPSACLPQLVYSTAGADYNLATGSAEGTHLPRSPDWVRMQFRWFGGHGMEGKAKTRWD